MELDQDGFLAWITENALGIFVIVVVLFTIVGFVLLFRILWRPVTRFVLSVNAVLELPETLATHGQHFQLIDDQLKAIKHEVLPNNGGSMRDEVNRQGKALKSITTSTASTSRRLQRVEVALELTQPAETVRRIREKKGL